MILKSCQTSRGILFPHLMSLLLTENCKDLGYISLKILFTKKLCIFFTRKFALCLSKSTIWPTVYCSNLNWIYFVAIPWTTAICISSTLRRMVEHHIPQKCLQGTTTTTVITTTTRITAPLLPTARTLFLEFQTQTVSPLQWMSCQLLCCFQICLWQASKGREKKTTHISVFLLEDYASCYYLLALYYVRMRRDLQFPGFAMGLQDLVLDWCSIAEQIPD